MTTEQLFAAKGRLVSIDPITRPKKAGGTYTVYVGKLDNGTEVDFGFKSPPLTVGADVNLEVKKEYGKFKYTGRDAAAGLPSAGSTAAAPRAFGGGSGSIERVFPVPRENGATSIIRQNALGHAVNTVVAFRGVLQSFQDPEGDPNTSLSLDEISNVIIKLAYKYTAFSSGNLDQILLDEAATSTTKKAA